MKNIVKHIDKLYLGSFIKRIYRKLYSKIYLRKLEDNLGYKFIIHYKKNDYNYLSYLCDKYGSDKGGLNNSIKPFHCEPHTYSDFYSMIFDHCRYDVKRVFECGIGLNKSIFASNMVNNYKPGASLRVWRDYFINAKIIGADINRDVLFQEERIETFYIDQTNPVSINDFWKEVELSDFDFILDDGLHNFDAGLCLFEHSITKLSERGIYIIEDVQLYDMLKYKEHFLERNFQVDYVSLIPPSGPIQNNNLIIIRKSQV